LDKVKKILFYSDSKIFGGHEIMSTKIANTLFDNNYKIEFMYYNKDFDYKLNENIKRYFNPIYDKTPLPFIANFNLFSIFYIYKRIKKNKSRYNYCMSGEYRVFIKRIICI
tara:strand:+ start:169 stop:501 length:333 start_codon:yes stop_codon:yes gene_type:complete